VSGWNGEKQAALKPQIPTMAPSTTSDGVVFQADTLNVADYQQCGGTGGETKLLCTNLIVRNPSI
jgi:hypothetical protein